MKNLKSMLELTKETMSKNKGIKQNYENQKQLERLERTTTEYNESSKEVRMIRSLGLNIDKYEPQDINDDYYEAKEYYYCSNDRYDVTIRNILYDADLGTILQVLKLVEKSTNEEINFYCDLWCENTHAHRLEQLKILLNGSYQDYLQLEFGRYYNLPQDLRDNGYEVNEKDYVFDGDKCLGCLEIINPQLSKTKCLLQISHYHGVSISLVNYIGYKSMGENITYNVEYKDSYNLKELCKAIDAIIDHIDGRYGYLEDNYHYTNRDVERLFEKFKEQFEYLEDFTDSYQYNLMNNDNPTEEEIMHDNELDELCKINHYKGAEIYKKYQILLNRDAYWFGGISNEYEIEFIYNLNLDKDNCIVNIIQIISQYVGQNDHNNDLDFENILEENKNEFTLKGTFTEVEDILITFLTELSTIKI